MILEGASSYYYNHYYNHFIDILIDILFNHRAPASDVTITKKWAWPTDFVWQKSMEV